MPSQRWSICVRYVSHRESILSGLTALDVDNGEERKITNPAMGELRILKVRRKTGAWAVKEIVRPSDLVRGFSDTY